MAAVSKASPDGEINKACQRLAKLRYEALAGKRDLQALEPKELQQLMADVRLVEARRGAHAGPLRNANANLRHYVKPHTAGRPEIVSVTQRLKKFSTILDKQCRYPTMKLSKMEDVGGVRAVVPDQSAADDISRRLRRTGKSRATATTSGRRRAPATGRCT